MFKGAIVLVPFPFTDLSGQKVRPALILHVSRKGEDCVVAFISSKKEKKSGDFDISIVASQTNGLKVNSVIKMNKIATLQRKIILGELGYVETSLYKEIDKKLKKLFEL
ncbi:MAG: type II toxin-antitoxin system PemK/MazF family toxin [Candidatus Taylorbacteria bacterium]